MKYKIIEKKRIAQKWKQKDQKKAEELRKMAKFHELERLV